MHATTCEAAGPVRIGVVSFVNTLPLIDGLETLRDVSLQCSVPSLLIDQLLGEEVDLALCSSIDYQMSPEPLVIVPAGLLGSDGATWTVRLYASEALDEVRTVFCDTDSHTSVALLRILLKERCGTEPEIVPFDARERVADNRTIDWPPAVLLIGDKVITAAPPKGRYPHELDLGEAWADLTGMPFVFAAWMGKRSTDPAVLRRAAMVLDRQRRANAMRLDTIIHHRVRPRKWPLHVAADYLEHRLTYDFTDRQRAALELFFDKAHEHGLTPRHRPIEILDERSAVSRQPSTDGLCAVRSAPCAEAPLPGSPRTAHSAQRKAADG
jgi:chorismate dehydratase